MSTELYPLENPSSLSLQKSHAVFANHLPQSAAFGDKDKVKKSEREFIFPAADEELRRLSNLEKLKLLFQLSQITNLGDDKREKYLQRLYSCIDLADLRKKQTKGLFEKFCRQMQIRASFWSVCWDDLTEKIKNNEGNKEKQEPYRQQKQKLIENIVREFHSAHINIFGGKSVEPAQFEYAALPLDLDRSAFYVQGENKIILYDPEALTFSGLLQALFYAGVYHVQNQRTKNLTLSQIEADLDSPRPFNIYETFLFIATQKSMYLSDSAEAYLNPILKEAAALTKNFRDTFRLKSLTVKAK